MNVITELLHERELERDRPCDRRITLLHHKLNCGGCVKAVADTALGQLICSTTDAFTAITYAGKFELVDYACKFELVDSGTLMRRRDTWKTFPWLSLPQLSDVEFFRAVLVLRSLEEQRKDSDG